MLRFIFLLVIVTTSLFMFAPTIAEGRDCYGCSCRNECWRNGVCRQVCRDSCGQFCFADPQAVNFTRLISLGNAQQDAAQPGVCGRANHDSWSSSMSRAGQQCIAR